MAPSTPIFIHTCVKAECMEFSGRPWACDRLYLEFFTSNTVDFTADFTTRLYYTTR
jgi:hypothetical protein